MRSDDEQTGALFSWHRQLVVDGIAEGAMCCKRRSENPSLKRRFVWLRRSKIAAAIFLCPLGRGLGDEDRGIVWPRPLCGSA